MRRRDFITLLGGAATAWPLAARAQQAGKVWRIGMLEQASAELNAVQLDSFRQGLREFGYVRGAKSAHQLSLRGRSSGTLPGLGGRSGSAPS
jgi:putative ABC transport system substrate-binding protein